jgi:hypothetical protein
VCLCVCQTEAIHGTAPAYPSNISVLRRACAYTIGQGRATTGRQHVQHGQHVHLLGLGTATREAGVPIPARAVQTTLAGMLRRQAYTRAPTMPGRAGVVAVLSSEKPLPPTRHFVKQSPFLSVPVCTGSLVKPSCLLHRSRVTAADRYRTLPPCFPGPAVTEPRHEGTMHCRLLS